MIRLEHVNKYYNRHKKNQIHVINDTTLELENTGLVAILGESGCGKTTLLNAIGGLDRISSGKIYIDGKKMSSRWTYKVDKMRNLNIGYIFQDYHLIDDMTVFDNVALALRMVGIKNKETIKKQVSYVLEAVNMYRYRNRLASNLSGGERQRVGIARALVKNPPIIIADEPTGNLDSKNTIEIMNVIKGISQTKLVILVTHEKDLAHFYASRIIELQDGKVINDYANEHENKLDYRLDNKLYLKDYAQHEAAVGGTMDVQYYHDADAKPLHVTMVVQNGNLYIQTNGFKKVEVVDEHSAIELVDDHYQMISKDDYQKDSFDMQGIVGNKGLRYASITNPLKCLVDGFRRISGYSIIKKMLLIGFCFAAMAMLFASSRVFGVLNITDDEFTTLNHQYLTVNKEEVSLDDYDTFATLDGVRYIMPSNSQISLRIPLNYYYQTVDAFVSLSGSLSDVATIGAEDLLYGRLPENEREIVVDRMCIETMFRSQEAQQVGILTIEDMLGVKAEVQKLGTLTVVGITDRMDPSIYTDASLFTNLLVLSASEGDMDMVYGNVYEEGNVNSEIQCTDYMLYVDSKMIKLKKGRYPKKDYEVMLNYNLKDTYKIGKKIPYKVNGKKLKVVGYYTTSKGIDEYLVSNQTLTYDLITKTANVSVYTDDKAYVTDQLHALGVNVTDPYASDKQDYIKQQRAGITNTLLISGIMIVVSLVEIFLMLRSSFLSRVKEVGVYRAIGVKKWDIYQMFLGEILATTLGSGIIGFSFMAYVISALQNLPYIGEGYMLSIPVIGISVVLYLVFNILVGLYPLYLTLRKTPAAILSRNDVD